jgi:hypothetical protein
MVFRDVRDSDNYCDEPAGKGLAQKIIALLNEPGNAETINKVLFSDTKLLKTSTFILLPKQGDSEEENLDVHNIAYGVLSLAYDNNAKNAADFGKLEVIAKKIVDMVKSAEDCRLKELIQGNIDKGYGGVKSQGR